MIKACLKNKRQAQHELYLRYAFTMKGVAMRYCSSEEEAEDILQDSFIRVFKHLKQYKDEGNLGAWIRSITVNTALELYRKNTTRKKHYDSFELEVGSFVSNDTLRTMDLEALLEKIQQLPDGYRIIFNLYAVEGYNHREIAEKLNISEGTSKSQYARAKKQLQQMILSEKELEQKRMNNAR